MTLDECKVDDRVVWTRATNGYEYHGRITHVGKRCASVRFDGFPHADMFLPDELKRESLSYKPPRDRSQRWISASSSRATRWRLILGGVGERRLSSPRKAPR